MCDISVLPKDGLEILDPNIWKEANTLVQAIKLIKVCILLKKNKKMLPLVLTRFF